MQWSLEDIYKRQVRGNIPPRKHLRVLGEARLVLDFEDERDPVEVNVGPDQIRELSKYFKEEGGVDRLLAQVVKVEDGKGYIRDPNHPEDRWVETDVDEAMEFARDAYSQCSKAKDPDECLQRLMRGVSTSALVSTFKDFLTSKEKAWNSAATANYAPDLARLMMPHAGRGSDKVQKLEEFLENRDGHPDFGTETRPGNLIKDFEKVEGFDVDSTVVKSLMSHSGVDERKRGVGMAELGMSLLFKNIGSATGAGDLAVLGIGEPDNRAGFEIKGHNAILGSQPEDHAIEWSLLKKFGMVKAKGGFAIPGAGPGGKDVTYQMNQFASALADIYTSIANGRLCLEGEKDKSGKATKMDTEQFKEEFRKILFEKPGDQKFDTEKGKAEMEHQFNRIEWDDPVSINSRIGLINFIMYASKEGFTHFLAHDFGAAPMNDDGTVKPGGAKNEGSYIYVTGKPGEMATQLLDHGTAKFEPIAQNNTRPRISAMSPVLRKWPKTWLTKACETGKLPSGEPTDAKKPEDIIAKKGETVSDPKPGIRRQQEWPGDRMKLYTQAEEEELARHIDELSA